MSHHKRPPTPRATHSTPPHPAGKGFTPLELVKTLTALATLGIAPGSEWLAEWLAATHPLLPRLSPGLAAQVGGGVAGVLLTALWGTIAALHCWGDSNAAGGSVTIHRLASMNDEHWLAACCTLAAGDLGAGQPALLAPPGLAGRVRDGRQPPGVLQSIASVLCRVCVIVCPVVWFLPERTPPPSVLQGRYV